MLKIDTGKKKAEKKGTPPQRFRQSLQWAGRTAFRLLGFGAGNAKDDWDKEYPEGHPMRDGNMAIAEQGGLVILSVGYNGEDFDVVDSVVLPNATTDENEQKVLSLVYKATGLVNPAATPPA